MTKRYWKCRLRSKYSLKDDDIKYIFRVVKNVSSKTIYGFETLLFCIENLLDEGCKIGSLKEKLENIIQLNAMGF